MALTYIYKDSKLLWETNNVYLGGNLMKKYGVKEENMKRRNKGITLMALVITVIVLLILATITISALSGNSIITSTINAREKAEIDDEIKLVGIAVNQAKNV